MAVLCGTYKRVDTYAEELGLPRPNGSTAIAILFDSENGSMVGLDNLERAAEVMAGV